LVASSYREEMSVTAGVLVCVDEDPGPCSICRGPMRVQKTTRRKGVTLQHGHFEVRERVFVCLAGCLHPAGARVTRRPACLTESLLPRSTVGYDVMVHVGLQRFVYYRQREEIRQALQREHGVSLSSGEISNLCKRFLVYIEELHRTRMPELRQALEADGGWPLHIDATCEDGRGTLLVLMAGWRKWVLSAHKIPTENADAILPHLHNVVEHFGTPCAIMRDLGRAVRSAIDTLVQGIDQKLVVLSCHLHFLADIGKDLLKEHHGKLRKLVGDYGIRKDLRSLARDLGRSLGAEVADARKAVLSWQQQGEAGHRLPSGRDGVAVVRSLCQWVLDFAADGKDLGFPFDRPYLDQYHRCHKALRAANAFMRIPPEDKQVRRALDRLRNILNRVESCDSFSEHATRMGERVEIFERLRTALRLRPSDDSDGANDPEPGFPQQQAARLQDIKTAVKELETELKCARPARGPARDKRQAIDLVLDHLERHGDTLWGQVIELPQEAGGGVRVVGRTNNLLENFFGSMKHGERRRSGRKTLSQDFELLPPAAALARNLTCPDYVSVICHGLEELPAAFAKLDADRRHEQLSSAEQTQHRAPVNSSEPEVATASLPTADRRIVRSEAMTKRVDAAARSRAPGGVKIAG
jgi:hypothetical protein